MHPGAKRAPTCERLQPVGRVVGDPARARSQLHGLPGYAAHHALTDALAAAELLLAQVAELERRLGREVLLRDLRPRRSG